MDRQSFFEGLKDTLELEDKVGEESQIHLTSLSTLAIIAYVDENFEKRVKVADLKNVGTVSDLMDLIGRDKFS
jgi:acyl carrier protein